MPNKYNRRFKKPEDMWMAWESYKEECDNETVVTTAFSQKEAAFVSAEVPHPTTYTLKGFVSSIGMTEQNFNATYEKKSTFESVIARMKLECELDARKKFEKGVIEPRLAGLWMSNYGYTTNVDNKVEADMSLNITVDYGDEE